jgi:hypothetical protein
LQIKYLSESFSKFFFFLLNIFFFFSFWLLYLLAWWHILSWRQLFSALLSAVKHDGERTCQEIRAALHADVAVL